MSSATITLITGINRSGKTLYALPYVEEMRKESMKERDKDGHLKWPEGRPVYYFAIPGIEEKGVLTEWKKLQDYDKDNPAISRLNDPGMVHTLPLGSIIVMDEAHRTYPNTNSKEPPAHVMDFDQCGHRGHTFVFLTQDARDMHLFIRRRVGKHFHVIRAFGLENATVLEWEKCKNPDSTKDTGEAQKHNFRYPKHVYQWYTSSDSHTIKKTIPWKWVAMLVGGPIAIVAILVYVVHRINNVPGVKPGEVEQQREAVPQPAATGRAVTASNSRDKVRAEGPAWASAQLERVRGMPMSASFYDARWQPVAVPRIAGCMDLRGDVDRCTCNTQQGTTITTITIEQCRFYVRNGWFDPLKPDDADDEHRQTVATASTAAPSLPSVIGN